MATRREVLAWGDVIALMDHLLPQMEGRFDALLMITRGGIIPGAMIAERMDINYILTAAVEFPTDVADKRLAWPTFMQFPEDELLTGRRILIADDIWASGRTITTVIGRVRAAGAFPETAVLHFKPSSNLFKQSAPTYYAALTDAYIVYPWEPGGRGREGVPLPGFKPM